MHGWGVRRSHPNLIEMSDQSRDLFPVLDRIDLGELRLQRPQTQAFEGPLIHEAGVQFSDFLLVRILGCARRLQALDDGPQLRLRVVLQFVKRAVAALVRWNLGAREPLSIDMFVEVVLRPDAVIDVLDVDPGEKRGRGWRRRLCRNLRCLAAADHKTRASGAKNQFVHRNPLISWLKDDCARSGRAQTSLFPRPSSLFLQRLSDRWFQMKWPGPLFGSRPPVLLQKIHEGAHLRQKQAGARG